MQPLLYVPTQFLVLLTSETVTIDAFVFPPTFTHIDRETHWTPSDHFCFYDPQRQGFELPRSNGVQCFWVNMALET